MKKNLLFTLILFSINSFAQLTELKINFDNEDDLVNNFVKTSSYSLTNINSNNVIKTPLSGTVENFLKLCNKYQGIQNETFKTSIDYKLELYPTATSFNSNSIAIFISKQNGDETILAAQIYNRELKILGLTNTNESNSTYLHEASFINNNWYRLTLEISKLSENKFSVTTKIFNIGSEGKDTPIETLALTMTGNNYNFKSTDIVNVNLVGGYWGNVRYLDNINVYGFKNGSNCTNLFNNEINKDLKISIFPNPTKDIINFDFNVETVEIFNVNGIFIKKYNDVNSVNIKDLNSGVYFLKIFNKQNTILKKIIKK